MPSNRGSQYYRWAKGESGRFYWKQRRETEEGFLGELIFELDLEGLTILRRNNILEAEKYPNDREILSVCEPGQDGWPGGLVAPQITFQWMLKPSCGEGLKVESA